MLEEVDFWWPRRALVLIIRMHLGNGSYVVSINRDMVPDDLRTSVFTTRW